MIKLSVVTVNLNNNFGLEKTITSVIDQTFTDFEFIVIDGASEDGSREVIQKYSDQLAYWLSEKDTGVYNAMNKGILRAKGKYLLFLNSGDYLASENVLQTLFTYGCHQDIIYGNATWTEDEKSYDGWSPDTLNFEFFKENSLPHQATFIKRSLFKKIGLYDEKERIISDWTFFVRAFFQYNCSYRHVNLNIAVCSRDGLSCHPANLPKILASREKFIEQYGSLLAKESSYFYELKRKLRAKSQRLLIMMGR